MPIHVSRKKNEGRRKREREIKGYEDKTLRKVNISAWESKRGKKIKLSFKSL
jgi:hypothetical protein